MKTTVFAGALVAMFAIGPAAEAASLPDLWGDRRVEINDPTASLTFLETSPGTGSLSIFNGGTPTLTGFTLPDPILSLTLDLEFENGALVTTGAPEVLVVLDDFANTVLAGTASEVQFLDGNTFRVLLGDLNADATAPQDALDAFTGAPFPGGAIATFIFDTETGVNSVADLPDFDTGELRLNPIEVPLPAGGVLLISGLIGLAALRRRA